MCSPGQERVLSCASYGRCSLSPTRSRAASTTWRLLSEKHSPGRGESSPLPLRERGSAAAGCATGICIGNAGRAPRGLRALHAALLRTAAGLVEIRVVPRKRVYRCPRAAATFQSPDDAVARALSLGACAAPPTEQNLRGSSLRLLRLEERRGWARADTNLGNLKRRLESFVEREAPPRLAAALELGSGKR